METPDYQSLRARVDFLERELADIKRILGQPAAPGEATVPPPPLQFAPRPVGAPTPARKGFELPEHMRKSEYWLSRTGIALLLFGLVFAFKYSIDRGWITPPVRHFFGIGLGIILFGFGWRLYSKRRHLSRLLLGGSVAAFYITDFSAFQLFELISYPTAFALMLLVTCLAFFISLRQDDQLFSLLGTIGGLATPFLLYTGSGNVPGLVGYTCLIIAATASIYFFKGWRVHLWLSALGGWIVLLIAVDGAEYLAEDALQTAQLALLGGIVFAWFCFGVIPIIRKLARPAEPAAPTSGRHPDSHLHMLTFGSPLVAFAVAMQVWPDTPDQVFGWYELGAAVLYGCGAWLLSRLAAVRSLGFTCAVTGAALLTLALCLILEGDALFIALGLEALALHLVARQLNDQFVFGGANLLSLIVGVWLLVRLVTEGGDAPHPVNHVALSDLTVMVMGVLIAFRALSRPAGQFYFLMTHLAFLGWLARELHGYENGQGYLSIAWGLYGAILLVAAVRLNHDRLRWLALGTLMLVVAKLFLIDLAKLETIWRVLLFMGFGAAFLVLSYYFPKLWKGGRT